MRFEGNIFRLVYNKKHHTHLFTHLFHECDNRVYLDVWCELNSYNIIGCIVIKGEESEEGYLSTLVVYCEEGVFSHTFGTNMCAKNEHITLLKLTLAAE